MPWLAPSFFSFFWGYRIIMYFFDLMKIKTWCWFIEVRTKNSNLFSCTNIICPVNESHPHGLCHNRWIDIMLKHAAFLSKGISYLLLANQTTPSYSFSCLGFLVIIWRGIVDSTKSAKTLFSKNLLLSVVFLIPTLYKNFIVFVLCPPHNWFFFFFIAPFFLFFFYLFLVLRLPSVFSFFWALSW